ncbi:hypothetical protein ACHAWF_010876 [Thalassiosira exigua]
MAKMILALLAAAAAVAPSLLASPAAAFAPPSSASLARTRSVPNSPAPSAASAPVSSSSLSVHPFSLPDFLLSDEAVPTAAEYARTKFWFYFFAGSGAGGIGIAQLPAVFRDATEARALVGTGSTLGGASLDAGPLVGAYYQSELSIGDVANAISKAPAAAFISERSQSKNFLASKGYVERSDFLREMEGSKCNLLASCALFDAISSGKGGLVSPVAYEEKLAAYREGGDGTGAFAGDLNGFLAVKAAAFLGLVFCLIVDFGLVAKAGIEGFLT